MHMSGKRPILAGVCLILRGVFTREIYGTGRVASECEYAYVVLRRMCHMFMTMRLTHPVSLVPPIACFNEWLYLMHMVLYSSYGCVLDIQYCPMYFYIYPYP
jgi:hypothetical protein